MYSSVDYGCEAVGRADYRAALFIAKSAAAPSPVHLKFLYTPELSPPNGVPGPMFCNERRDDHFATVCRKDPKSGKSGVIRFASAGPCTRSRADANRRKRES